MIAKKANCWFYALTLSISMQAMTPGSLKMYPNLEGEIARPIRYTPDHGDFIIENGEEFFNRPLYGGNTAFRVDAGDRPELVMYLPGRGGNIRLGIQTDAQFEWFQGFSDVVSIYRAGSMIYELADERLLGAGGKLKLTVQVVRDFEGVILEINGKNLPDEFRGNLVVAYGGVNGQRGVRDGDIGTEKVPISEWFQLQPEFALENQYQLEETSFYLTSPKAEVVGVFPRGSELAIKDARQWNHPESLLSDVSDADVVDLPILVASKEIRRGEMVYCAFQKLAQEQSSSSELSTYVEAGGTKTNAETRVPEIRFDLREHQQLLPDFFNRSEAQRATVSQQIRVQTPDDYLNSAVSALCSAADAVWDEPQQAVMHGAIAWRSKLLGWRGPYSMDALGWHDRAKQHLSYWATRQNTDPIPEGPGHAPAEEKTNLARMRTALHTNGDIQGSHYDMNLVYVDAVFRHLNWTGDLEFAKAIWPTLERHLDWEKRLFRREFGPEKLPLYEAYAAIWASDDLEYHGGGVAYSSAYNYWHNLQMARLADLLGYESAGYREEAALIARAMRENLWMPEEGMFAEFKDLLGKQLLHRSPGLWSFYHTIDSEIPSQEEAFQMTQWVDQHIPHIPVQGPGVPNDGNPVVLSTTNWMPYTWSVNNVTMNENIHAALAYWQAGRIEKAYRITRGSLFASMFMGICPGNVGSMNYLDVYRRESQRDFADGSGVLSRAIVEGLFGVKPDLLADRVQFHPGFPEDWNHASLEHSDIDIDFERNGPKWMFRIQSRFPKQHSLDVLLPAITAAADVTVNGIRIQVAVEKDSDVPTLNFQTTPAKEWMIEVSWKGPEFSKTEKTHEWKPLKDEWIPGVSGIDWQEPIENIGSLETVDLNKAFNDKITAIFELGKYRSPRSEGVSMAIPAQGIGAWAGHVNKMAEIDDRGLRSVGGELRLENGVVFRTPAVVDANNIMFVSQWDNYPESACIPLEGNAEHLYLLMTGSTNHMQSRIENARVVVRYRDGSETVLPLVNPTNWWPIDQDYFVDDYQFHRPGPIPPRVDLKTGLIRYPETASFKGTAKEAIPGGAATILQMPLDPEKTLENLIVEATANEVVVGLMAITLQR